MNKTLMGNGTATPAYKQRSALFKKVLIMKITVICLLFSLTAWSSATGQFISIVASNTPFRTVIKQVQQQSGFSFTINERHIKTAKPLTLSIHNQPLATALALIFKEQPFGYRINGNIIISVDKNDPTGEAPPPVYQDLVRGRVTDTAGNPVANVTVAIAGTPLTTMTDEQGRYQIAGVKMGQQITFSSIGFETASRVIDAEVVNMVLHHHVSELSDINITVNTGYQTLPKERATGSFATVSEQLFNQQTGSNILDRLPAIANSVVVDKGTATGSGQLLIRGISTITGPKAPLIVLDNFPYEEDINSINPNMVENITILKDAAAASIWGARAANGVIVITTKNARMNQPIRISVNANTTYSGKPDLSRLKIISSSDFIDVEEQLFKQGFYDGNIQSSSHTVLSPVVSLLNKAKNGIISDEEAQEQIDALRTIDTRQQFRRYMYQPALNQQYFLSASGGGPRFSWISDMGYDNNKDNLSASYQRISLRFQNTWQPIKPLTINSGIYYIKSINHSGRTGYGSVTMNGNSFVPYMQLADDAGNPLVVASTYDQSYKDTAGNGKLLDWNYYPLTDWQHSKTSSDNNEIIVNTGMTYNIIKGLQAELRYQYQLQTGNEDALHDVQSYYARSYINSFAQIGADGTVSFIVPKGGILDKTTSQVVANNFRGQLNYNNSWADHSISAIIGGETRSTNSKSVYNRYYGYDEQQLTTSIVDFLNPYPNYVTGSMSYIQPGQSLTDRNTRFVSLYANAAYSYKNRYTISGSARRDASNLFGLKTNEQWNPFWSAGLAWDISKEQFYKIAAIPKLRLRGSYGFNGNIDPAMVAVSTIAYGSNSIFTGTPTARFDNYLNPGLKWESSRIINLAVDFTAIRNRIEGSVEYFTKKGDNLFGNTPMDYTTGIDFLLKNVAAMKGHGWDIELKTLNINRKFKWSSLLNLSIYHDKVTNYYISKTLAQEFISNSNAVPIAGLEGKPVYSMFAYKWGGLDPQTGDPQGYLDDTLSKDYTNIVGTGTKIEDLQFFGSAVPTIYGSFINSFSYKNFSLNVGIVYKLGYWLRSSSVNYTELFSSWTGHSDYSKRWQQPGDEAFTNVPSNPWETSSNRDAFYKGSAILVEKADHIRLQYVNLNYDVDKKHLKKLGMQGGIQLYFNANNLGILWRANKKDIDPDYNMDYNLLVPPTEFSIGARVKF
ncbi:MAG: SusC/RagA family TonB-linked outer membrane protein [Niabella sp.]